MSREWDDLPEWEKEQARDEAFDAAHGECELCDKPGCIEADCPSYTCCGLPPLVVPESEKKFELTCPVRVHAACLEKFEKEESDA